MSGRVLSMVECFRDLEDPRQQKNQLHLLVDVVCLAVLAVIAGAEGWEDIEEFGKQKQTWLNFFSPPARGRSFARHVQSRVPRPQAGGVSGSLRWLDRVAVRPFEIQASGHRRQDAPPQS